MIQTLLYSIHMNLPTHEIMYEALLTKDSYYEGQFFVGVKTTGIFCRNTCTARKPKKENVEYFQDTHKALLHGYRPCKVCHPLDVIGKTPPFINDLLEELDTKDFKRITDWQLREKGFDPIRVRRWFLKNHGITFHTYQRLNRVDQAIGLLKNGANVTQTAYDLGYESLSGFGYSMKKMTGTSPILTKEKQIIKVIKIPTPLGPMIAAASNNSICLLEFTDRKMLPTEIEQLKVLLNAVFIPGSNKHLDILVLQLKEYFAGKRKVFTLPLVTPGSQFQQAVWKEIAKIPYGQTRTYTQQAIAVGSPRAVRAVARTNGLNRLAIIIPCHRIIGANGALTGYAGGLVRKQWLLDHENKFA